MAKYKVLMTFRDKETKKTHTAKDEPIDLTVKRATEINKTLEEHGVALERVDEKKEE